MQTRNQIIVVGVDGSDGGRRALRWAINEAVHTGATVEAVTAWHWDGVEVPHVVATNPWEESRRAEEISKHEVESALTEAGADVPITREVVQGPPAAILANAARRAALLILGSHGHGRMHQAVLGSVSEECIRRANCPVVVIPVPHPDRAGTDQARTDVEPATA
jgi:nucleotide-binding universal stress UspA family protein